MIAQFATRIGSSAFALLVLVSAMQRDRRPRLP